MAKQLNAQSRLAQTNVGTPIYMSPELINEQAYDERSDIWAVGCCMYEAAALCPPFSAKNQMALALKVGQGKGERVRARVRVRVPWYKYKVGVTGQG